MRVHYLQHEDGEDIGNMREWFDHRRWLVTRTLMHCHESLPAFEDFDWLVIMGGSMSAYDDPEYAWLGAEKQFIRSAIDRGKKVIGICLGAQLLADVLGGRVYRAAGDEIGWFEIKRESTSNVAFLPACARYLSWHGDTFDLPPGAMRLASSEATLNQGFVWGKRVIALQFHLEAHPPTPETFRVASGQLPTPGKFIQDWSLLQGDAALFETSRSTMHCLLDQLAAGNLSGGESSPTE